MSRDSITFVTRIPESPGLHSEFDVQRWDGRTLRAARETVIEEAPIAFVYNGMAHAVMMATPSDLEDFALGFSLSEGIVQNADELRAIDVVPLDEGVLLRLQVDAGRAQALESRRRSIAGRSSCGLCGAENIEQVMRALRPVTSTFEIPHTRLHAAFETLAPRQALNARTGAAHAAGWADASGALDLVREDVGRHNALDKLIGGVARAGVAFDEGFALITSRASFEMVQKAATVGIPILAAISAPTALAIRVASESGVTLAAFARDGTHNVYTHPQRLCEG